MALAYGLQHNSLNRTSVLCNKKYAAVRLCGKSGISLGNIAELVVAFLSSHLCLKVKTLRHKLRKWNTPKIMDKQNVMLTNFTRTRNVTLWLMANLGHL